MPEEVEVETKELQEKMHEIHEEEKSAWTRYIALSTAGLAVVAAIAALQSGSLVNEALLEKSEAVQLQSRASDQWAYYQAKSIKGNMAEQTAAILQSSPAQAKQAARYSKDAARYASEKEGEKQKAEGLEEQRDEKDKVSAEFMHQHHIFAYCVTFTQVAIALSAIAALTRIRSVWYFSLVIGIVGIFFMAKGFASAPKAAPGTETKSETTASEKKPDGKEAGGAAGGAK